MTIRAQRMPRGKPRTATDASGRPSTGFEPKGGAYLYPGTLATATLDASIRTILGSCVAVCLWDSCQQIGGMNHFLLPTWTGRRDRSLRFGNVATEELISQVVKEGARRSRLRAKIFGGSHVIGKPREHHEELGTQNARVARKILERERIPIVLTELGGPVGRGLVFRVSDGMTWHRFL